MDPRDILRGVLISYVMITSARYFSKKYDLHEVYDINASKTIRPPIYNRALFIFFSCLLLEAVSYYMVMWN